MYLQNHNGLSAWPDCSADPVDLADRTDELQPPAGTESGETALPVGTQFQSRYILESVIGVGGTGIIYQAKDLGSGGSGAGHPIAIKMVRPQWKHRPTAVTRLKQEFRRTATLDHPSILRVFDLDCEHRVWFITMELLEGETLKRMLQRKRSERAGRELAQSIAAACIAGLAHAHGRGVTHGDIKPGNIMIGRDGSIRLIDFGAGDSAATDPLPAAATRAYASPEVLNGAPPDARDDIFSLGCVIYEMLTGHHPFARCASTVARNVHLQAARPDGMSAERWHLLRSALAWQRADRPADVRRLLDVVSPQPAAQNGLATPGLATVAAEPVLTAAPALAKRRGAGSARIALLALGVTSTVAIAAWLGQSAIESMRLSSGAVAARQTDGGATEAAVQTFGTADRPAMTPVTKEDAAAGLAAAVAGSAQSFGSVRMGFDKPSFNVSEGTSTAALTLRRIGSSASRASIGWTIRNGTATAGKDYAGPLQGVATLARGQSQRTLYIPIIDDALLEGVEHFEVELHSTSSARTSRPSNSIRVTIVDND